jgi:hypothetical protein
MKEISVVDRHRFVDMDPDFDQTFQLKPIRIRIPPYVLHMLENLKYFKDFYSQQCQSTLLYLSRQNNTCHNFHFLLFWTDTEIFWKKDSKTLQLVEMDQDPAPDRQALDPDPEPPR